MMTSVSATASYVTTKTLGSIERRATQRRVGEVPAPVMAKNVWTASPNRSATHKPAGERMYRS